MKQFSRIGIDIVAKSKCYLVTRPRSPPVPAPTLPVLALREALFPLDTPWSKDRHSVVIFASVQGAGDCDDGAAVAERSCRLWRT